MLIEIFKFTDTNLSFSVTSDSTMHIELLDMYEGKELMSINLSQIIELGYVNHFESEPYFYVGEFVVFFDESQQTKKYEISAKGHIDLRVVCSAFNSLPALAQFNAGKQDDI